MSNQCSLQLSTETLSDWNAQMLSSAQAHDIAIHVARCPVCMRRLADFEIITRAVRTPQPLPSTESIWRELSTRIMRSERTTMPPSRKPLFLGGLVVSAMLVVIFAVVLVSNTDNRATVPPHILSVSPSQGWVKAKGLENAKAIAFAQSAPLTGYACGNDVSLQQSGNSTTHFQISVTHDGGLTWSQQQATNLQGRDCLIDVNPSNSQDLIMQPVGCASCNTSFGLPVYRSLDGGQNWTLLTFPKTSTLTPPSGGDQFAFAGDAFFEVAEYTPGDFSNALPPFLAVAIGNQSLKWVDSFPMDQHTFPGAEPGIVNIFAIGQTVTVELFTSECPDVNDQDIHDQQTHDHCAYLQSSDQGQTWTYFTRDGLPDVSTIQPSANGSTLIGFTTGVGSTAGSIVQSTDTGKNWDTYATYPPGVSVEISPGVTDTRGFLVIADGSIYYQNVFHQHTNILAYQHTGAGQWVEVVPSQAVYSMRVVSTDTHGRPLAIWADRRDSTQELGFWYHAP